MAGLYTGFKTPVTNSFYHTGLDWLEPAAGTVTDAAQEQGWRYTGWDSLHRNSDLNRIENATNQLQGLGLTSSSNIEMTKDINLYGEEAKDGDFVVQPSRHPVHAGIKDLMKEYNTEEINIIPKETLNNDPQLKELGLTFDVDTSDLEVSILMTRKKNEIRNRYVLNQAQGGRFAKGFFIEMGMAMLDPLGLAAGYFALPAKVSQMGILGSAKAGAKAAAMVEVPITAAAQREQADYGMYEALANVAFGGVAGGGLHALGRGIANLHAKRLAVKQLAENEQIDAGKTADVLDDPDPDKIIRSVDDIDKDIKKVQNKLKKKVEKSKVDAGEQLVERNGERVLIRDLTNDDVQELKEVLQKKVKNKKANADEKAFLKRIKDYEKQVKDGEKAAENDVSLKARLKELQEERLEAEAVNPETILRNNIAELEQRLKQGEAVLSLLDSAKKQLRAFLDGNPGKNNRRKSNGKSYIDDSTNKKVEKHGPQPEPEEPVDTSSDELFADAERHIRSTASMSPAARKQALDDLKNMKKLYLTNNDLDSLEDGIEQLINCGKKS